MQEKRNKKILIKLTESELEQIDKDMKSTNMSNRSAYIRKMVCNGYIINLEIPQIQEISSLLNITSNNVNQLTKFAHSTGNIYQEDVENVNRNLYEIKDMFGNILSQLSKVGV